MKIKTPISSPELYEITVVKKTRDELINHRNNLKTILKQVEDKIKQYDEHITALTDIYFNQNPIWLNKDEEPSIYFLQEE